MSALEAKLVQLGAIQIHGYYYYYYYYYYYDYDYDYYYYSYSCYYYYYFYICCLSGLMPDADRTVCC